jgi:hypothetical protein
MRRKGKQCERTVPGRGTAIRCGGSLVAAARYQFSPSCGYRDRATSSRTGVFVAGCTLIDLAGNTASKCGVL